LERTEFSPKAFEGLTFTNSVEVTDATETGAA
jgi:hypothetical protein